MSKYLSFFAFICTALQLALPIAHSQDSSRIGREGVKDPDTISTDTLYSYLFNLATNRPGEARGHALRVLTNKVETTPDNMTADLLKIVGLSYYYEAEYRSAITYLDSSLYYYDRSNNTSGIISSYLNLGNNYSRLRSLDTSLIFYKRALDLAIESQDQKLFNISLLSIGNYNNDIGNYRDAEEYYTRFLRSSIERKDEVNIALAYFNLGVIYQKQMMNFKALKFLFQSLEKYEEIEDPFGIIEVLNSIGIVFTENQDYQKASEYFTRALALSRDISDDVREAETLGNIGASFLENGQIDSALVKFEQTLNTLEKIQDYYGMAPAYYRIGETYKKKGLTEKAYKNFKASLDLAKKLDDRDGIAGSLIELGKLQNEDKNFNQAKTQCSEALKLAKELNSLDLLVGSYDCLAKAYTGLGRLDISHQYLRQYISFHDSLDRLRNTKEVTRLGVQYQYEKEMLADSLQKEKELLENELAYQAEISRERNTKRLFLFGSIIVLVVAIALLNRLIYTRKSSRIIRAEKEKSENLLLNILPSDVAEELKTKGYAEARQFDQATILFSDFTDFTLLSEQLSPKELVDEIHYCYRRFDEIVTKHQVEKIKTIGDAYMAAGGLSEGPNNVAYEVIIAALEMQKFISDRQEERWAENKSGFSMRLGIHSGPVVAGIVGIKKFQYDIWGDTVNTAYRLQETGENGKVNISQATYECVKDRKDLVFEHRGKISAKNKAEQDMYFVSLA